MAKIDLGKVVALVPQKNVLWSKPAGSYINDGDTFTPSKNIRDCANGWNLRFRQYGPGQGIKDWGYHSIKIHKDDIVVGKNTFLPALAKLEGRIQVVGKQVYMTDTYIKGHADNSASPSNNCALYEILEW